MTEVVIKQEQSVINSGDAIRELKDTLKSWKPKTKVDTVKMLTFLSVVGNAATVKKLKDSCYQYLDERCAECENAVDAESGLEVVRVEVNKNVFNTTPEIEEIEKDMALLKARLKSAQEAAGVSHTETTFYYKAKI
jgi:uncharacterized coiled-coil protein SlyX